MVKYIILALSFFTCVVTLLLWQEQRTCHKEQYSNDFISQVSRNIQNALHEGNDVVICRPIRRSIYSNSNNKLKLAMITDFEVIMSIKDEFVCGSIISLLSISDMAYRDSVDHNFRSVDSNKLQIRMANHEEMINQKEKLYDFPENAFSEYNDFYREHYITEMFLPLECEVTLDSVNFKPLLAEFDKLKIEYDINRLKDHRQK